jgi:hypothetical protein
MGLAAGIVLLAATSWWIWSDPRTPAEIVASIVRSSGARLEVNGVAQTQPFEQEKLNAGRYALLAGLLEVEMAQGARLILEAPARFVLNSGNKVELLTGNLSARVPESAVGFRVETPSATVIDLGTEFGVSASNTGSEIHVFKGEVLVQTSGETDTLRLTANRASRTDVHSSVPRGIEYNPELFLRTLEVESSEYGRQVQSLGPVLYLPMDPPGDGVNLATYGIAPRRAWLEPGPRRRTCCRPARRSTWRESRASWRTAATHSTSPSRFHS